MMMKKLFLILLAFTVATLISPEVSAQVSTSANRAGASLLETVLGFMTGNLGTLAGLLIAALGLWSWIISQNTWGIMLILFGVVLTAFPSMFAGLSDGTDGVVADLFGRAPVLNRDFGAVGSTAVPSVSNQ